MERNKKLGEIPATLEDVVLTLLPVIVEVVAATSPPQQFETRLDTIGNRLLEHKFDVSDVRSRIIIDALAKLIVGTERMARAE